MAKLCLYLIWLLWGFSWVAAGFWSAPTVRRAAFGRQLPYRLVTLLGFLLLFGLWSPRHTPLAQFWQPNDNTQWLLDLVGVLGFAFSWWARVSLGPLWSSTITRKEGHHLIDTGPYALVRHPIYTGIIIAAFAAAALQGTLLAICGAIVMTFGWYLKAQQEEEFLRGELPAYDAYAGRTAMLIPFLKF